VAHEVFISYASVDKTTAEAVCAALEEAGISCWMAPRDVEAGARYAEQIVAAIRAARVLVLVFSAASNASEHVERELDCAVSAGLAIVALRIEELAPAGALQYYLAGRQWCDALTPSLAPHLERLGAAVRGLLESKKGAAHSAVAARPRRTRRPASRRRPAPARRRVMLSSGRRFQ